MGHYEKIDWEEFDCMHLLKEKEIKHIEDEAKKTDQKIQVYRPDMLDILNMDIASLPDGTQEKGFTMEDLQDLFAETEEARKESLEKEEKLRAEIAEKEALLSGKDLHPQDNKRRDIQEGMTYAERLVTFPFTEEQKAQAMLGVEHGLSEEVILKYFRIEISAENMAVMRELAEGVMKRANGAGT